MWLALLAVLFALAPVSRGAGPPDREGAARANNIGVALLEQFRFPEAAEAFRKASALDPGFHAARVNLGIALFYVPDLPAARRTLESALEVVPDSLHAHYVLGLIARHENRVEDALARLRHILAADPGDVGANVGAAQVLLQSRQYAEAIPLLEAALRVEPYNVSAAYNLGLALARSGRAEEGARATARFQQLRESPYKTSLGTNYLEQGRYAEALATTGAEPDRVDTRPPEIGFVDRTRESLPPDPAAPPAPAGAKEEPGSGVALADLDRDGDLDLVEATRGRLRLLRNDGGRFTDVTGASGQAGLAAVAAIAGDLDNDGTPDLLVVQAPGLRLLKGSGAWRFTDVTTAAKIAPAAEVPRAAALVDVDHDGDLDVFVAGTAAHRLMRNNGDGTFAEIATDARLAVSRGRAVAVVPTDFDERRDIDLLVVHADAPPALYKNLRDGTFADVAGEVGLPAAGGFQSVAAGDVNKDGFTDFFLGSSAEPGTLALSDGRGRFTLEPTLPSTRGALAALFVDHDRDGLLDLAVLTSSGPRLLRNLGKTWTEVTARAFPGRLAGAALGPGLAAGDLDGDGAQDLATVESGSLRVLRAEGRGGRAFRIDLTGRVSNRGGVGAKVELRAGSLRQKIETSATTPAVAAADVVFGLGPRTGPDAVRVLWPSGVLQTEIDFPAAAGKTARLVLDVTELDRKPSSCPYLYAWDGGRFGFVTDFLGGGEMGYWLAPRTWNVPDPEEQVRLSEEQLRPRDGVYEVRVTNELEEVLFLDRVALAAVAHPPDVEVHPYEGMTTPPKPSRLYAVGDLRAPAAAFDDHGHDVRPRLLALDRTYPDDFPLHRIRGYAGEHALVLDLGAGDPTVLLLTGWTDYAFSSDNVAAHQAGLAMRPPFLQMKDAGGEWRTVVDQVGIPVGRPQTVLVDLAGLWLGPSREVRIVTNMRIYWDQARVGRRVDLPLEVVRLDAARADLRERGFSAVVAPDGREPFTYDHARVSGRSPWKLIPGRYTRTGDVRELLGAADDLFVISRPGDEIAVAFESRGLPPLPAGWRRTFLLHADGFSKELDINSATPDVMGPLPFRGMSRYPYAHPEAPPLTEEQRRLMEKYTTRVVAASVPTLDLALADQH